MPIRENGYLDMWKTQPQRSEIWITNGVCDIFIVFAKIEDDEIYPPSLLNEIILASVGAVKNGSKTIPENIFWYCLVLSQLSKIEVALK